MSLDVMSYTDQGQRTRITCECGRVYRPTRDGPEDGRCPTCRNESPEDSGRALRGERDPWLVALRGAR